MRLVFEMNSAPVTISRQRLRPLLSRKAIDWQVCSLIECRPPEALLDPNLLLVLTEHLPLNLLLLVRRACDTVDCCVGLLGPRLASGLDLALA